MDRPLVLIVGLPVLLSACASTRTKSEEHRVLVEVGMTAKELRSRIGAPAKAFAIAPTPGVEDQTVEVWEYSMTPPPGFEDAAQIALAAGALVVFTVATNGRDTTGLQGFHLTPKSRFTFWVGFGSDGRVRGVTNLRELR